MRETCHFWGQGTTRRLCQERNASGNGSRLPSSTSPFSTHQTGAHQPLPPGPPSPSLAPLGPPQPPASLVCFRGFASLHLISLQGKQEQEKPSESWFVEALDCCVSGGCWEAAVLIYMPGAPSAALPPCTTRSSRRNGAQTPRSSNSRVPPRCCPSRAGSPAAPMRFPSILPGLFRPLSGSRSSKSQLSWERSGAEHVAPAGSPSTHLRCLCLLSLSAPLLLLSAAKKRISCNIALICLPAFSEREAPCSHRGCLEDVSAPAVLTLRLLGPLRLLEHVCSPKTHELPSPPLLRSARGHSKHVPLARAGTYQMGGSISPSSYPQRFLNEMILL